MWQKGSITVFYSFILSLILALISSLLLSAKIAAGRAQTAMAMDQAMYSAMAKYDAELLEEFHLFFLDGGLGSNTLQPGKILDELESDFSYVLTPSKEKSIWGGIDFLDLSMECSAITGYTLATDQNGSVFREQVVQYMKDTMVLQGISSIIGGFQNQNQELQSQTSSDLYFQNGLFPDMKLPNSVSSDDENFMERLENIAEGFSSEDLEPKIADTDNDQTEPVQTQVSKLTQEDRLQVAHAKEVLKTVEHLKSTSILHFVVKTPEQLSGWETEKKLLISNRKCQTGMGLMQRGEDADNLTSKYLFQEYLIQNMNHYRAMLHNRGPAYGLEYIICGKGSDVENLEGVIEKMLIMRAVANTAYLYTDAEKRASVQSIALLVASAILLPELEPVIEAAIVLAWAYVESLVDIRGLLSGKAVPLLKNSSSWQVGFDKLLLAVTDPDSCCKSSGDTYYEDYLSMLLYTVSEDKKTMRAMEVIELTMRGFPGKEKFSMDCAIDTLEIMVSVVAESKKNLEITERRSYRCM